LEVPGKNDRIIQSAENRKMDVCFMLMIEAKEDFPENINLSEWAQLVKKKTAAASKYKNRKETELVDRSIGDRKTIEYEVTGDTETIRVRARIILLEHDGYYCKLYCWTIPSRWEKAQAEIDNLVLRLKSSNSK
jgi:hypothetical protein